MIIGIWLQFLDKWSRSRKSCFHGWSFFDGNPGLSVLTLLSGYGLSNKGVGGHTCNGNFKYYNIIAGFII